MGSENEVRECVQVTGCLSTRRVAPQLLWDERVQHLTSLPWQGRSGATQTKYVVRSVADVAEEGGLTWDLGFLSYSAARSCRSLGVPIPLRDAYSGLLCLN